MANQPERIGKLESMQSSKRQDADWIKNELKRIANVMRDGSVTPEAITETVEILLKLGIERERLVVAFERVRLELKFFPRPVEIMERLPARKFGIFKDDQPGENI